MHLPGIRIIQDWTIRPGRLPCALVGTPRWELSDGDISSCLPVFPDAQHVDRFQTYILLPTKNLTIYQVGVVTNLHVRCEDPLMIVMNESGDYFGSRRRQRQCGRKPRYDSFKYSKPQTKTCVFQCLNHGLNSSEVTVTVQFNIVSWINDDNHLMICEIEAYTFWKRAKEIWWWHASADYLTFGIHNAHDTELGLV